MSLHSDDSEKKVSGERRLTLRDGRTFNPGYGGGVGGFEGGGWEFAISKLTEG